MQAPITAFVLFIGKCNQGAEGQNQDQKPYPPWSCSQSLLSSLSPDFCCCCFFYLSVCLLIYLWCHCYLPQLCFEEKSGFPCPDSCEDCRGQDLSLTYRRSAWWQVGNTGSSSLSLAKLGPWVETYVAIWTYHTKPGFTLTDCSCSKTAGPGSTCIEGHPWATPEDNSSQPAAGPLTPLSTC